MDTKDNERNLVNKYIKKGYSNDIIVSSFVKAGYNKEEIEGIVAEIRAKKVKTITREQIFFAALGISVVLFIILLFLFINPVKNCKDDTNCFMQKANNCETVEGYKMLEGNKVNLRASNCFLTKEIVEFDSEEPVEIVDLFKGKKMTCSYEKGSFDSAFFELTGSLDKCDGELKDSMISLRLAQIEAESTIE